MLRTLLASAAVGLLAFGMTLPVHSVIAGETPQVLPSPIEVEAATQTSYFKVMKKHPRLTSGRWVTHGYYQSRLEVAVAVRQLETQGYQVKVASLI